MYIIKAMCIKAIMCKGVKAKYARSFIYTTR